MTAQARRGGAGPGAPPGPRLRLWRLLLRRLRPGVHGDGGRGRRGSSAPGPVGTRRRRASWIRPIPRDRRGRPLAPCRAPVPTVARLRSPRARRRPGGRGAGSPPPRRAPRVESGPAPFAGSSPRRPRARWTRSRGGNGQRPTARRPAPPTARPADASLDHRLREEFERARRYSLSFSLVLLDVERAGRRKRPLPCWRTTRGSRLRQRAPAAGLRARVRRGRVRDRAAGDRHRRRSAVGRPDAGALVVAAGGRRAAATALQRGDRHLSPSRGRRRPDDLVRAGRGGAGAGKAQSRRAGRRRRVSRPHHFFFSHSVGSSAT